LREAGTGFGIGVYGGVTPAQNGDLDVSTPRLPGASLNLRTKDRTGGVAGIKVDYTWASFGALADRENDPGTPSILMPALAYDLFWTGLQYRASDATFGSGGFLKADMDLITFQVEPMLKFRLGRFHPYVGIGVGGTYLTADNASVTVPGLGTGALTGSSETVCFSMQGLVGAEFFVTDHWALTAEYKYLFVDDPQLQGHGAVPIDYHADSLGFHMMTAGVKYAF
jgi:opacity protein-like surface antigen